MSDPGRALTAAVHTYTPIDSVRDLNSPNTSLCPCIIPHNRLTRIVDRSSLVPSVE